MAKTYHISFNGTGWTEFFPSNEPSISWERTDEMFMRYSIDSLKITKKENPSIFATTESMFFNSSDFSNPLYFKVQKSGVDKYFFKSSVNESEINTQNGSFEIKPRTNDDYEPILGKYNVVYQDSVAGNLFGAAGSFYIETENTNIFLNQTFDAFTDTADVITWANTAGGVERARQILDEGTGNGHVFQIAVSNFSGDEVDISLVRTDGSTLNSNVEIINTNGVFTLIQNSATASVYLRIRNTDLGPGGTGGGSFTYNTFTPTLYTTKGKLVKTLIEDLLADYMDLTYDVVSTYLWNDALETDPPAGIDTFITANPTSDYVIRGAAVWNGLFITKTHTFTADKNVMYEITFADLMGMLKTKFRAWWFIDSDGKFRIEHERYFKDYDAQIAIASYSTYKPEVDASVYRYEKGDIVSVINYSEPNAENADFIAAPIVYDQSLTTPNSKDIISPLDISTDLKFITADDGVQNSGYTLIQTTVSSAKYFATVNESFYDSSVFYVNQKLSWANLFSNYWKYYGESSSADINGGTTLTLSHVKEFLKQDNIKFFYSGELDWKKPITLSNGTGWLDKFEETDSEFLTINVGFNPY